jgi:hypothetical protein
VLLQWKTTLSDLGSRTKSFISFVSTTNTARSVAGFVSLALALTPRRSSRSSGKLYLAL